MEWILSKGIDWEKYRAEFPAAENYIYFNHAAVSPMSTRVRKAVDTVSDMFLREGMLCEQKVFDRAMEVRAAAAELIGASPGEIAFTRNTTQGVLLAANGINMKPGDNVVMPAIEFPANVYPWMGLTRKGVELRMVEPDEGKVTAEMLSDVCDKNTRAVTVSYAQFSNGYRIDCEELGSFCRSKGIFLHVDSIQALGAIDIDVKRENIDFLSCGGHKWMLSMPGIGIFYCRKELISQLELSNPGWTGVINKDDYLDYEFTYRDDAARFEEGAPNFQGIFALGAAIDCFLEIGLPRVEERIMELTGLLASGLEERGYLVTSPFEKGERSGIICFTHPEKDSTVIHRSLSDRKVVCSLREGAVRLSPHFYNDETEIERLFKMLEVI